jgi:hypothetical protein
VHPHTTMRSAAPDPASLLRRAPALPRVPWLRIPPPRQRGLQYCHASCGSKARLPIQEGSSAVTRPEAQDPASPVREGSGAATRHTALYGPPACY